MTIPRWMLALLSVGAAALGALVGVISVSIKAGERLGEMSSQIAHLSSALTPAVVTVGAHEARLVGVETRLNYCCPQVAPGKASASSAVVPSHEGSPVLVSPVVLGDHPSLSRASAPRPCLICEPDSTALGWLKPGVLLATSRSGASVRAGAERDLLVGAASGMVPGAAIASEGAGAHRRARIASTLGTGSTPALATTVGGIW